MSIAVLLVDDHGIMREGLRALLDSRDDMHVVGETDNGRDAVAKAGKVKPDVVVMDLTLPDMNGIEATRRIVTEVPGARVLCLSFHSEQKFVLAALEAGASGYLLKEKSLTELVRAILTVSRNEVFLCPRVAGKVLDRLKGGTSVDGPSRLGLLTGREREVLQLLAEGWSTKEIADRLRLSVKTIGTHREHVMDKLDIRSIAGLTKFAIRQGLTSVDG